MNPFKQTLPLKQYRTPINRENMASGFSTLRIRTWWLRGCFVRCPQTLREVSTDALWSVRKVFAKCLRTIHRYLHLAVQIHKLPIQKVRGNMYVSCDVYRRIGSNSRHTTCSIHFPSIHWNKEKQVLHANSCMKTSQHLWIRLPLNSKTPAMRNYIHRSTY